MTATAAPYLAGNRTEGIILGRLIEAGYVVSIPFGTQRYDLVVEIDGHLKKVQVKTARLRDNCIKFNACSVDRGTLVRKHYRGEVDYFAAWCPENSEAYLVPVDVVPVTEASLRLQETTARNGRAYIYAADYRLGL